MLSGHEGGKKGGQWGSGSERWMLNKFLGATESISLRE